MSEHMGYQPPEATPEIPHIPLSKDVEELLKERTRDYMGGKPQGPEKDKMRAPLKEVRDGKMYQELTNRGTDINPQELN